MTKLRDYFRQYLGYYAVGLVSVLYIFTAIFILDRSGKSIARIIGDGALAFLLGMCITRLLSMQGIVNGEQDEQFISTCQRHADGVTRIFPFIGKLYHWCEIQNTENLQNQRTIILADAGLKYADSFDENGITQKYDYTEIPYKPFWKSDHKINNYLRQCEIKKLKAYIKAVKLKLTPLNAGELTSEGGRKNDRYYLGRTKTEYEKQSAAKDTISRLLTAGIFGYYGIELIANFSYARLLWYTLQVALFLLTGIIKMYQSNRFITGEFRNRIVRKTDILQEFENSIKEGENGKQSDATVQLVGQK